MKSKIFLFLLLFPIISFSQKLDRFIIGADWFNSRDDQSLPLSSEYWNLGREFGLNFVTLNFKMDTDLVLEELNKSYNNNVNKIDVELNSSHIYGPLGGTAMWGTMEVPTRRWLYQIEGTHDFINTADPPDPRWDIEPGFDQFAETHWSIKNKVSPVL